MSEKTALWDALATTPTEYLKDFNKGFRGKSIDPTYRIRRLTEAFGPCGVGWKFVTEDRWMVDVGGSMVAFVSGYLQYRKTKEDEWYRTCSHTGGTVCDRNPDEAYKCSETDALGKACLDIGLAADVYLGMHDGDKYQLPATSAPVSMSRPMSAPHEVSADDFADDKPTPRGGWQNVTIPFGKNKDKPLSSLSTKSLQWYVENYKVNPKFQDSVVFGNALQEAARELNIE